MCHSYKILCNTAVLYFYELAVKMEMMLMLLHISSGSSKLNCEVEIVKLRDVDGIQVKKTTIFLKCLMMLSEDLLLPMR